MAGASEQSQHLSPGSFNDFIVAHPELSEQTAEERYRRFGAQ